MPFTIHEGAAKKQIQLNVTRPQEAVPADLPEAWTGTMSGGLPVRQIPHLEFPRVVYMHPNEPYQEIEHRNDRFEVVSTDLVPTEHLTRIVKNESELQEALESGWVKEPYIPKAAPSKAEGLYGARKKAAKARE